MKLTYYLEKVNIRGTLSVLKNKTSVSTRLHLRDKNSLAAKAANCIEKIKCSFQ